MAKDDPKTTEATHDDRSGVKTDGGEHFVVDQLCDQLERLKIEAIARTNDRSIRWHHGPDVAKEGDAAGLDLGIQRTWRVTRDGWDNQDGLSHQQAKDALNAFGTAKEPPDQKTAAAAAARAEADAQRRPGAVSVKKA